MQIQWTKLPFPAHNRQEFAQNLTDWLGQVFYEELPAKGYEVREEQIYTSFRIARALLDGNTLMAEAGPGTGKTFAYLLPVICYARFKGAPVIVSSASSLLQAQLADPDGDVQTLSRLLGLEVDARVADDPEEYLCEAKVNRAPWETELPAWLEFRRWAQRTGTGARREVPDVPDELWQHLAWEPTLPCDTCQLRGHCHVMSARRRYRATADLIICNHRFFARDLLTRQELLEGGNVPLLPPYSAVVFDEGHHLPETWQRAQGATFTAGALATTFKRLEPYAHRSGPMRALALAKQGGRQFVQAVVGAAEPGDGKRTIAESQEIVAAATHLRRQVSVLQDEMVTEEAMSEGLDAEVELQAYQARLDGVAAALRLFQSEKAVRWVEGEEIWAVPQKPLALFGRGRLAEGMPVIFSSATLEPAYMADLLQLDGPDTAQVGVPFDLGEQVLVFQPAGDAGNEKARMDLALDLMRSAGGRTLVLLRNIAEVARWKESFSRLDLPWPLIFEGDGDRGALLERFRREVSSVLFGATFWEGVDVVGESLSCCVIPGLPFPAHDPLIRERRRQVEARGGDPFAAVDVPEMLLKLKQGAGRLIRSAADRGVLALLDQTYVGTPWEGAVRAVLPEDAEETADVKGVTEFLG